MKIKVVVIDFEVPTRVKQWALRIGIPVLVLGGFVALAYASVPVTFTSGEVLQAADLNTNFQSLDQRLTAVEAAKATLVVDGNGVLLGRLLQLQDSYGILGPGAFASDSYTFLTTTGYVVQLNGDGSNPSQALFFSNSNCTGSAYASLSVGLVVNANKTICLSGQCYAPANPTASGLSPPAALVPSSPSRFENGCGGFGSQITGVLMTPLTSAQVGLPATIASPLKLQ
jgi:hypothetical protein